MLFSSLIFIVLFLPAVLAGTFILTRFTPMWSVKVFLLLVSLVFYGWTFPSYVILILYSITINFLIGRILAKSQNRIVLVCGIFFNLSLLGWYKYGGFFAENLSQLLDADIHFAAVILPLAISFFTFQQIAYLVDVSQRKIKSQSLLDYAFFVSFFPQLIAGPIVHHTELIPQLKSKRFVAFLSSDLISGLILFSIGLAKKVLIADQIRIFSDRVFVSSSMGIEISLIEAWLAVVCYSFQIYFDFSGYSDMALGLGKMFGLKLPKNFNSPYKSKNIIEFWRSWNITLSHFLRDYLYFPLGGNKKGVFRRYGNLWIVMLLGGLWHGASWTFVAWGSIHGLYLILNHAWRNFSPFKVPVTLSIAITFIAVCISWVFFRADNIGEAINILNAMIGAHQTNLFDLGLMRDLWDVPILLFVGSLIVWFMPNGNQIIARFEDDKFTRSGANALTVGSGALAAISIYFIYAKGSYEFLYFQF